MFKYTSKMSCLQFSNLKQNFLALFILFFCCSDLSGCAGSKIPSKIPVQDQQTALSLLLELSIQRGSLSHILSSVLLLLNLWNNSRHEFDNRVSSSLHCAPLIPFLKRFQNIQMSKSRLYDVPKWEEVSCDILVIGVIFCSFLETISEFELPCVFQKHIPRNTCDVDLLILQ